MASTSQPSRHPQASAKPGAGLRAIKRGLPMTRSKRRAKALQSVQPRPLPPPPSPPRAPAVTIKLALGGEGVIVTLRDGRERYAEDFAMLLAALQADQRPAPRPANTPPPPRAPLVLANYQRLGLGEGRVPRPAREFERQLKRQARKVARARGEYVIDEALNALGLF